MATLSLSIPDSVLSALRQSPAELGREMKLAAAIHWYERGLMSQERAADVAGLKRRDFIRTLAKEGADVFVLDADSLARELGHDAGEPTPGKRAPLPLAWLTIPRSQPGVALSEGVAMQDPATPYRSDPMPARLLGDQT